VSPKKLTLEFAQRHDLYGGPWVINEVKADGSRYTLMFLDAEPVLDEVARLRTALTGISTCSSCEVCRGAALRALGESKPTNARRIAGMCCEHGVSASEDCQACRTAQPPRAE
jgi:hypothetical protein